jgi:hypothetical protein
VDLYIHSTIRLHGDNFTLFFVIKTVITGGSFPGVKRPGRESVHSPPASAAVKKYVDLYIHSTIRLHGDNFTSLFFCVIKSVICYMVVINGDQSFANPFLNRWLTVNVCFPLEATNQKCLPRYGSERSPVLRSHVDMYLLIPI